MAGLMISSLAAHAATNTFKAGTSWSTAGDWSNGAVQTTDALLFSTLVPATTTLEGSITADTLEFNHGASTMEIDARCLRRNGQDADSQ